MEFLVGEDVDDDDDDEDFCLAPTSPMSYHLGLTHVAAETLPRSFCYEQRHVQVAAVGMQSNTFQKLLPHRELESFSPAPCYTGYYTLTMRGAEWNCRNTHAVGIQPQTHIDRTGPEPDQASFNRLDFGKNKPNSLDPLLKKKKKFPSL